MSRSRPPADDCNVAADGLSAVCSPVSGGTGGTVPGAAAAATPSSYAAELPFLIPTARATPTSPSTSTCPRASRSSGGAAHLMPYTSRTADVRLALDSPVDYAPAATPSSPTCQGLPAGYTGPVRILKVEGDATITGSPTPGCAVDAGTLLCSAARRHGHGRRSTPPTRARPPRCELRVGALTGYRDPAGANNASTATLKPKPVDPTPDADLAFTLDTPSRNAGLHQVTGHVTGLPNATPAP